MFLFLLVTEATAKRVTFSKLKLGHVLKDVQYLGHPLLQALHWLWGTTSVQMSDYRGWGGGGGWV